MLSSVDLFYQSSNKYSLKNIITGDENWVCNYDIERKTQNIMNGTSFIWQKKAQQSHSIIKIMLIVLLMGSILFIISYLLWLSGKCKIWEAVRKIWVEMWVSSSWILHCDDAAYTDIIPRLVNKWHLLYHSPLTILTNLILWIYSCSKKLLDLKRMPFSNNTKIRKRCYSLQTIPEIDIENKGLNSGKTLELVSCG